MAAQKSAAIPEKHEKAAAGFGHAEKASESVAHRVGPECVDGYTRKMSVAGYGAMAETKILKLLGIKMIMIWLLQRLPDKSQDRSISF